MTLCNAVGVMRSPVCSVGCVVSVILSRALSQLAITAERTCDLSGWGRTDSQVDARTLEHVQAGVTQWYRSIKDEFMNMSWHAEEPFNEILLLPPAAHVLETTETLTVCIDVRRASLAKLKQAAQARINSLTQSILAKAIFGELTAEWRAANPDLISGENSAEALVAKIKAERKAVKKNASKE